MQTCWFFLFWFSVSFKTSPAPVSRAFGDSNWVLAQEQKAIFSEENRELKKKKVVVGGGEWVRDILLSPLLFWPSLPPSLCLCCDGKDRNKPPLQVGVSPRFPSSSRFPSVLLFLFLLLFFASPYPSVISPRSPVAVFVVSWSQRKRKRGRDKAAQVPGASMKSLQRRDD